MSTQHTRIYEHKFRCNGYLTVWSAVSFLSLGYFYKTIWSSSYGCDVFDVVDFFDIYDIVDIIVIDMNDIVNILMWMMLLKLEI